MLSFSSTGTTTGVTFSGAGCAAVEDQSLRLHFKGDKKNFDLAQTDILNNEVDDDDDIEVKCS
jgi:hypothetical protein